MARWVLMGYSIGTKPGSWLALLAERWPSEKPGLMNLQERTSRSLC
jgi:hypothetical protein